MPSLEQLADLYNAIGAFGFFLVSTFMLVFVVITQYFKVTKRMMESLGKLEQEYQRLSDIMAGTSAFIQSFMAIMIQYSDVLKALNEQIKKKKELQDRNW